MDVENVMPIHNGILFSYKETEIMKLESKLKKTLRPGKASIAYSCSYMEPSLESVDIKYV